MKTKFYKFNQSNSGGQFEVDDFLCRFLYIEAVDHTHANTIAESLGIYFNGSFKDKDCFCCGDRWSRADTYSYIDLDNVRAKDPTIKNIESYVYKFLKGTIKNTSPEARIIYLSGVKTEIYP